MRLLEILPKGCHKMASQLDEATAHVFARGLRLFSAGMRAKEGTR